MKDPIIDSLFNTNAIRVSNPEHPFWYASGTIGPFYINTHFLVGNETDALEILSLIETASTSDRISFPQIMLNRLLSIYNRSSSYKMVIDQLVQTAKTISCDFISGGERRDFFFSILTAYFLNKPHLSIFKDFHGVYSQKDLMISYYAEEIDLTGKTALHVVDLVTEASSYSKVWIPVIRNLDAEITDTIAVVDRKQGGKENLHAEGVELHALTGIDPEMFQKAMTAGVISNEQYAMVIDFMNSPIEYMKTFFRNHPSFISDEMKLGGKAKERAELALSKGYADSSHSLKE